MTVNDRLIKGGKSRYKVGAAVTLVALFLDVGIASAETHLKAATLQPRLDISSAAPKILSMNDVDLYRDIFRVQEDGHLGRTRLHMPPTRDPLGPSPAPNLERRRLRDGALRQTWW